MKEDPTVWHFLRFYGKTALVTFAAIAAADLLAWLARVPLADAVANTIMLAAVAWAVIRIWGYSPPLTPARKREVEARLDAFVAAGRGVASPAKTPPDL